MDNPMSSPHSGSFSQTLEHLKHALTDETVTLRDLLVHVGEHGLLSLGMVLTLPFMIPISLPGFSTVFGLAIIMVGLSVAFRRLPWMPSRVLDKSFLTRDLLAVLARAQGIMARLERAARPRWSGLAYGPTANRINGVMIIGAAVLLMVPWSVIPFSNTLPALAVLLICVGMMRRDGAAVLAGYGFTVATLVYFAVIIVGLLAAGQSVITWMS